MKGEGGNKTIHHLPTPPTPHKRVVDVVIGVRGVAEHAISTIPPSHTQFFAGIPEEGCNNYQAINQQCSPMTQCFTCWPTGTEGSAVGGCKPVKKYKRLLAAEHGRMDTDAADLGPESRAALKAEIMARGPVSAGIAATAGMDAFEGGRVFAQFAPNATINHIVSIVGWGVADPDEVELVGGETDESAADADAWAREKEEERKTDADSNAAASLSRHHHHRHHDDDDGSVEYWIIRNSWGAAYADDGFFRIVTSAFRGGRGARYNLAMETGVAWAVPGDWVEAEDLGFVQEALVPAAKVQVE